MTINNIIHKGNNKLFDNPTIVSKNSNDSVSDLTAASNNEADHNDGDIVDDEWSIEFAIEELFLCLARVREEIVQDTKTIHFRKYYHQARILMKWIPIAKPSPEFIINISDLTPRIAKELQTTHPETLNYVITQAVGRIFENIDFERYHHSVARNLRVRFEK